MHINSVQVINYGPLENFKVNFKPNCLNIIQGSNGHGKTQLFGALLIPLLGEKVVQKHRSPDFPNATISITTTHRNVTQTNELNYIQDDFLYKFNSLGSFNNKNPMEHQENISYYHAFAPLFLSPEETKVNLSIDVNDIELITHLIMDDTEALKMWNDIVNTYLIKYLKERDKNFIHISQGLEQILKLIKVVCIHAKNKLNTPIVIDGAFMALSSDASKVIFSILSAYSKSTQIILFAQSSIEIANSYLVAKLPENRRGLYSSISYDTRYNSSSLFIPSKKSVEDKLDDEGPVIVRYIKGATLDAEEYRYMEFKEVKGNHPIRSILSVVDQYVVAYLNERKKQFPGRIIWGITDEERKVVGTKLVPKDRDELRRSIVERLDQIQPPIPPSSYKIDLKEVYDSSLKHIEDTYVVEIIVDTLTGNDLFATAKNEVYIKTDGGKKKLNHIQIQQEILLRNQHKRFNPK
ncbi:RNA-binding domain-containing protein [Bacillus sp. IBL03825]|uniref:RNA-binding domain-containing protein n=1 Tax=Bacillus sp. IBL03825 TaxID=2953580 RepID=UPI0021589D11|nr:RNA-binding domain-containing protein [Bacillus sp. IBL03825]MCR6850346.1 putative DNA binding domain-containing protein [Bacillus sp. IBL03825]